jgi:hypothetical protein
LLLVQVDPLVDDLPLVGDLHENGPLLYSCWFHGAIAAAPLQPMLFPVILRSTPDQHGNKDVSKTARFRGHPFSAA